MGSQSGGHYWAAFTLSWIKLFSHLVLGQSLLPTSLYPSKHPILKSVSCQLLFLSLNSFCTETERTWVSLHPETKCVVSAERLWICSAQLCPTLCDPTAARQASLSITNSWSLLKLMPIELVMPSNHLSSPSPPAFNLSQHQGLFKWISSLHQVAKALEFQLQHQSFQWIFRTDFL